MEQSESLFENIPPVDEKTRVEIYGNLSTNIKDILKDKGFAKDLFTEEHEDASGVLIRDLETKNTKYKFIRNLGKEFSEIQIQRSYRRIDNPNLALEEIRFRIGRPVMSFDAPDFEYHRTLKNGGSRTLKNNTLALKRIEKFIEEMKLNLQS